VTRRIEDAIIALPRNRESAKPVSSLSFNELPKSMGLKRIPAWCWILVPEEVKTPSARLCEVSWEFVLAARRATEPTQLTWRSMMVL